MNWNWCGTSQRRNKCFSSWWLNFLGLFRKRVEAQPRPTPRQKFQAVTPHQVTTLISNGFHSPIYNQVNHQRRRHASARQRMAQLQFLAAKMSNKSKALVVPTHLPTSESPPTPPPPTTLPAYLNSLHTTLTRHFNQLFNQLPLYPSIRSDSNFYGANDNYTTNLADQYYYFIKPINNNDASATVSFSSSSSSFSSNLLFLVCLLIAWLESVVSRWIGQAKRGCLFGSEHFFHILIKCKCLKILGRRHTILNSRYLMW